MNAVDRARPAVRVRYWAGAQRAAGVESETVSAETVGDLRSVLADRPGLRNVSAVASILVDGRQAADTTRLADGDEVDVLPPFAGGAPDTVRMTATVSGHVQGVGFRAWVRRHAESAGLVGSATNLPNGCVEVVAEGSRPDCERLLETLQGGESPGSVNGVSARWLDAADDLDGFLLG